MMDDLLYHCVRTCRYIRSESEALEPHAATRRHRGEGSAAGGKRFADTTARMAPSGRMAKVESGNIKKRQTKAESMAKVEGRAGVWQ